MSCNSDSIRLCLFFSVCGRGNRQLDTNCDNVVGNEGRTAQAATMDGAAEDSHVRLGVITDIQYANKKDVLTDCALT